MTLPYYFKTPENHYHPEIMADFQRVKMCGGYVNFLQRREIAMKGRIIIKDLWAD